MVCDGYDGNGMFHFNYGFGGDSDGYYDFSIISSSQRAIVGIKPKDGSSGIENANLPKEIFDVYTINGIKVRSMVYSLDGLPKGIYIVNGKKVVKKE